MAIKVVDTLWSKIPSQQGVSKATQVYTVGQLLMEDKTNGYIVPATSSVTTLNCLGQGVKSFTEGSSNGLIKYIPIMTQGVFCVVDCTNVTAANQLQKDHLMTDSNFVNNTSTTNTSLNGVFHAIGIVGAIGGTKLYGYFIRSGQVTV